jgi:hypothetical protein
MLYDDSFDNYSLDAVRIPAVIPSLESVEPIGVIGHIGTITIFPFIVLYPSSNPVQNASCPANAIPVNTKANITATINRFILDPLR